MINSLLARRGLIRESSFYMEREQGVPVATSESGKQQRQPKKLEIKIKAAQMLYKNT